MSDNHELPAYSEIDELLKQSGAMQEPAESHGLLSALLCAGKEPIPTWLSELHPEQHDADLLAKEARETLEGFAAVVKVQLQGADFSYELMVPADDESLPNRVLALAQWCQGFYLGLGIAGIDDLKKLPEDSREVVKDMTEIAGVENYAEETEQQPASEEDEAAYAELVEYLRVGVLLIFEELSKPKNVTEH
ncbi:MAG: UPF0149 family protein [Sulfuriflexus sp.]|nr:UPF0149 family protein [Sulfuriflexus sp.]